MNNQHQCRLSPPRGLARTGVIALVVLAFNPDLSGSLYLSIPVLFLPMIIYWVGRKTGRIKAFKYMNHDEKTFDELFPDKRVNR